MKDTRRGRQRHRQREKQAPCRKPNVGLDPRTPGSCPGPNADAQPLSHPGIPTLGTLNPLSIQPIPTLATSIACIFYWKKRMI